MEWGQKHDTTSQSTRNPKKCRDWKKNQSHIFFIRCCVPFSMKQMWSHNFQFIHIAFYCYAAHSIWPPTIRPVRVPSIPKGAHQIVFLVSALSRMRSQKQKVNKMWARACWAFVFIMFSCKRIISEKNIAFNFNLMGKCHNVFRIFFYCSICIF